jgi:hypothetical protein
LFTCFDILIFEVIAKLFQICSPSLDGRGLRDGLNCNMLMSWTPPHSNPPPPGGRGFIGTFAITTFDKTLLSVRKNI